MPHQKYSPKVVHLVLEVASLAARSVDLVVKSQELVGNVVHCVVGDCVGDTLAAAWSSGAVCAGEDDAGAFVVAAGPGFDDGKVLLHH